MTEVRRIERMDQISDAQTRVRQRLIHLGTCSIDRCATSVRRVAQASDAVANDTCANALIVRLEGDRDSRTSEPERAPSRMPSQSLRNMIP